MIEPSATKNHGLLQIDDRTHLTDSGLVVKNLCALDNLNVRMYKEMKHRFFSHEIFTVIRKRFNSAAARLSIASYGHWSDSDYQAAKEKLRANNAFLEGVLLEEDPEILKVEIPYIADSLPIKLVSPASSELFLLLAYSDRLLGILEHARRQWNLDIGTFNKLSIPVKGAVSRILTSAYNLGRSPVQTDASEGHTGSSENLPIQKELQDQHL